MQNQCPKNRCKNLQLEIGNACDEVLRLEKDDDEKEVEIEIELVEEVEEEEAEEEVKDLEN